MSISAEKEEQNKIKYEKNWSDYHETGKYDYPSITTLELESQARLNRMLISKGAIGLWWDDTYEQYKLKDAFVPAQFVTHVERLGKNYRNPDDVYMKIAKRLDESGSRFYPELTDNESILKSTLSIRATFVNKFGAYTDTVRLLSKKELKWWLRFHNLSKDASEHLIFVGK